MPERPVSRTGIALGIVIGVFAILIGVPTVIAGVLVARADLFVVGLFDIGAGAFALTGVRRACR